MGKSPNSRNYRSLSRFLLYCESLDEISPWYEQQVMPSPTGLGFRVLGLGFRD